MSSPVDCPLIEISGSPLERGRQYGEQATNRIRIGIGHYGEQLDSIGLRPEALEEIIGQFAAMVEGFGAHYLEEMRGIAEGADVDLASVILLNCRTEVLKIARRRQKGLPDFIEPDGCTGVIALPEATAQNRLLHAQNWDWKAECADTAVVVKIHRDDGPDILTFTEAGGLARAGFNAAGISITGNYLETERDYKQLGIPLALIRRKVLEQQHLAMSMQAVHSTAKSASNNMMIGHAGGIAIDFECAPDETFLVHPDQGVLVHANHFKSPVALTKLLDKGIFDTPDSLYRDLRVRNLLQPNIGQLTPDLVKEALFDDFEWPWSVCRPPRMNLNNNMSATVAMIVMEPALGRMEVALLPAIHRHFSQFQLDMDIAPVGGRREAA
jgi:isopenicillin-N N-acyltransferase-like protein